MIARKKPINVMCVRFTDSNSGEIHNLLGNYSFESFYSAIDNVSGMEYYCIRKEQGDIYLKNGDWLMLYYENDKTFWTIDDDIFKSTYELIDANNSIYRKKPIEVTCIELKDLSSESINEIEAFIKQTQNISNLECNVDGCYIIISTLEGDLKMYVGDVLVRGVAGEVYPVSNVNFTEMFEVVSY